MDKHAYASRQLLLLIASCSTPVDGLSVCYRAQKGQNMQTLVTYPGSPRSFPVATSMP